MMFLKDNLRCLDDKDYGQECKGEHMCIGGGSSRPPEPTQAEKMQMKLGNLKKQ